MYKNLVGKRVVKCTHVYLSLHTYFSASEQMVRGDGKRKYKKDRQNSHTDFFLYTLFLLNRESKDSKVSKSIFFLCLH